MYLHQQQNYNTCVLGYQDSQEKEKKLAHIIGKHRFCAVNLIPYITSLTPEASNRPIPITSTSSTNQ